MSESGKPYEIQEKRRPLDGLRDAWTTCCSATITLVLLGIGAIIPIIVVIIGALTLGSCPVSSWIPKFLIIIGSISLFKIVLNLCCRVTSRVVQEGRAAQAQGGADCLVSVLGIVLFILMIFGSLWVYGNIFPSSDSHDPDYCHPIAYWTALVIVTLWWVFGVLACCLSCCYCCIHACQPEK